MINSDINRFMMSVYKNKSSSDAAQVPTAATIDLYRVGGQLNTSFSLPPNSISDPLNIDDPGQIVAGDTLAVLQGGSLPGPPLMVEEVTADNTITLINSSSSLTAVGAVGDRLVLTTNRPLVYPTQAAVSGAGSSIITSDATTGSAVGYMRNKRFDALVTIPGSPSRFIADGQSIPVSSPDPWVNARDFENLQLAADAVPAGGRLYIPGDMTVPSGGLVISRAIEIFGQGLGHGAGDTKSILRPFSNAANQPVIKVAKGNSYFVALHLHDLLIQGAAGSYLAGSDGVQIDLDTAQITRHIFIERVQVSGMGGHGFYVNGIDGGASTVIGFSLTDSQVDGCRGHGLYVHGATLVNTHGCLFANNHKMGAFFDGSGASCTGDYYENNCLDGTLNNTYDGQLKCFADVFSLRRITFEAFTTAAQLSTTRALILQTASGYVGECFFTNGPETATPGQRGIFVDNTQAGAVLTIGPCWFTNCLTAIECGPIQIGLSVFVQNRGVGTNAMVGVPGIAILQVPTSALPMPPSTAEGQLVWDSTNKAARIWNGSRWTTVTTT
jgi:hypothetical protein